MKTITLKGIPEALYRALKRRAEANRRSLNAEVLVCLERETLRQRPTPEDVRTRAEAIRERTTAPYLTDDLIRRYRDEGRMAMP